MLVNQERMEKNITVAPVWQANRPTDEYGGSKRSYTSSNWKYNLEKNKREERKNPINHIKRTEFRNKAD